MFFRLFFSAEWQTLLDVRSFTGKRKDEFTLISSKVCHSAKKIHDERFLNLIWKLLNAGYMDLHGRKKESLIGSPEARHSQPDFSQCLPSRTRRFC